MLSTKNRLSDKSRFDRAKKKGRIFQNNNFGMFVFHREDDGLSEFGFVVSKKISNLAVERNRIKRTMNDAVRYNLTEVKNGFDVVFLMKKRSLHERAGELVREVREALKVAKLLKS